MFDKYMENITDIVKQGDAREESFYSTLENLFYDFAEQTERDEIHITTQPKQTEAGNPDFRIWEGNQKKIGYIEAKPPHNKHLDKIEQTEQLKRYRDTFPNLILTNFTEFRLYRDGKEIDSVQIAQPDVLLKTKPKPPLQNRKEIVELLEEFYAFSLPRTYSAEQLAIELAKRTKFLRDEVIKEELKEAKDDTANIHAFYDAFKTHLISGLSKEQFADLYSQTITYGLFAARTRSDEDFNRERAYEHIPNTIGILRDIFEYISLGDIPESMKWILDDIAEVLAVADVKSILDEYHEEGKESDPIIHFYETFLEKYDPDIREKRGVYYTPEPVVSYIVRSIHQLLKDKFGLEDGLADQNVRVLDPAAGTATFLAKAAEVAMEEHKDKYGSGDKPEFVKQHLLENFYGFELMMAPYAIGHIKMALLLEELGYELKDDERIKLYLTNTLEMEELEQTNLPGMNSLSKESHAAGKIKKEEPILVILGNPPYNASSKNKSTFIEREMELYKEDVQDEKNIQNLSDDYIKFLRFSHWKIDQSGEGIIGMITNNSYLDGLIHRGMRKKLMESFGSINILNLHGNARIGETAPDGSKDENVFDIKQGVSIALFTKENDDEIKIESEDLFGKKDEKYKYLCEHSIKTTEWEGLKPDDPYNFFVRKNFTLQEEYEKGIGVKKIFNAQSSAVTTSRDNFAIGFSIEELKQRMTTFKSDLTDDEIKIALDLNDTNDWKVSEAREQLSEKNLELYYKPLDYRPFDHRFICYTSEIIDRDRMEIMRNFFSPNIGLICRRSVKNTDSWQHSFITTEISEGNYLSARSYVFPLYLYPDLEKDNLFTNNAEPKEREPNIKPEIFKMLKDYYGEKPSPEDIFYYIYGITYSNTYREKYEEFLKIDFPRIPFTEDYDLFKEMGELGKRLADLHLLKSDELNPPVAKFQGEGDTRVAKPKKYGRNYNPEEKRIYINKDMQYFEGIEPEVWEYHIGGYQVLDKWLFYRREKKLTSEEIKHLCKTATALQKSIEVQEEIDDVYGEVEEV